MLMATAYHHRKDVSILLVVSMMFSLWMVVPKPAHAGFFQTVGKALRWVTVTAGSLAGAALGGVVGMAIGGGPIGMVIGGAAGYIVSKKLMNWATSSFVNVATALGAVGGAVLTAGMGFPMLAIGVVGGALIARGVSSLIKKLTGKNAVLVNQESFNVQVARSQTIIDHRLSTTTTSNTNVSSSEKTSAQLYELYIEAYRTYLDAVDKGDATKAKKAYSDYQTYLAEYNRLLKAGK